MMVGMRTSFNPRSMPRPTVCPPSNSWNSAAHSSSSDASIVTAVSVVYIVASCVRKTTKMVAVRVFQISVARMAAFPALRTAAWSFRPTALLIRMVEALAMPSETMNVSDARFRAIWWAARVTAPIQPIMIAPVAKPNASMISCPAIGRPVTAIVRRSADVTLLRTSRMAARTPVKNVEYRNTASTQPRPITRDSSVATPAPSTPMAGAPRLP